MIGINHQIQFCIVLGCPTHVAAKASKQANFWFPPGKRLFGLRAWLRAFSPARCRSTRTSPRGYVPGSTGPGLRWNWRRTVVPESRSACAWSGWRVAAKWYPPVDRFQPYHPPSHLLQAENQKSRRGTKDKAQGTLRLQRRDGTTQPAVAGPAHGNGSVINRSRSRSLRHAGLPGTSKPTSAREFPRMSAWGAITTQVRDPDDRQIVVGTTA